MQRVICIPNNGAKIGELTCVARRWLAQNATAKEFKEYINLEACLSCETGERIAAQSDLLREVRFCKREQFSKFFGLVRLGQKQEAEVA
ncbi:MAG: hypothetical protein JRJ54_13680 [Deltaproteobacteria bacterium]|nr:hypothetical protein [Deltaproteobacteria bacterium]